jgi:flavin-dependent dehydrogenase
VKEFPQQSTDVFVIGGGPAGLAAATAARLRGLRVVMSDSSHPPIDKACGEGVMPDGLAAAATLGIRLDGALGQSFRGIRFCDKGASVEAPFPSGCGIGIRRTTLHALMVERAADVGVRLAWGTHVTGIARGKVMVDGRSVSANWIVGADGLQSQVRRWAGLDASTPSHLRFGFRRHYRVAPRSEYMEVHWGKGCQLYITPVAPDELCVAVISRDPHLRLETALPRFPDVFLWLDGAAEANAERGGASVTRRLKSVCRDRVALIGDASGSVDAITGEGLCLLFQQAAALAAALEQGDLARYQEEHRRIGRRSAFMANLMLSLDRRDRFRHWILRAFARKPDLFRQMLATHVGEFSAVRLAGNGLSLGWEMLRHAGRSPVPVQAP